MLQRVIIHLSLILLFAFTQMGVATHAISHIADGHEQHQQDQNNTENQCGQCLSLSHAADASLAQIFDFKIALSDQTFAASILANSNPEPLLSYSARAPPYTSQT